MVRTNEEDTSSGYIKMFIDSVSCRDTHWYNYNTYSKENDSLGTPETNLSGLRTRKVLSMERSGPAAFPSSDFGINIGRNLNKNCFKTLRTSPISSFYFYRS